MAISKWVGVVLKRTVGVNSTFRSVCSDHLLEKTDKETTLIIWENRIICYKLLTNQKDLWYKYREYPNVSTQLFQSLSRRITAQQTWKGTYKVTSLSYLQPISRNALINPQVTRPKLRIGSARPNVFGYGTELVLKALSHHGVSPERLPTYAQNSSNIFKV